MKRWTVALLAPALWGAGPASLLVGVVHDQFGRPVAGARVQAGALQTATDAAGTFALPGSTGAVVVITCAYCETAHVRPTPDQPVVAIVRRYDAVAQDAPTDRDIEAMRYSNASSSVSLRPYAVLNGSTSPEPGPRVSFFGVSPFWGGLTIDDGIPSYDIAAGSSTFSFFPALATQRVAYGDASSAFRYGESAGAGTFFVDTRSEPGTSADAMAGSEYAGRLAQNRFGLAASAGFSSTPFDSRDRLDATANLPLQDDALSATFIAASSRQNNGADQSVDSAFNAGKIEYRHNATVQADLIFDNSGYNGSLYEGAGVSGAWSDFEADAGVQSAGAVQAFGDASIRTSTGLYADPTVGGIVAGTVSQDHVDAGVQIHNATLAASAGLGLFSYAYTGGSTGVNQPLSTNFASPGASIDYSPVPQVTASISSGEYFRLPTLLEVYAPPGPAVLQFQRTPVTVAKIGYGDLHRFRVEIVDTSGGDRASGASLAWEIAPNLSLRAWTLAFDNTLEHNAGTVNAIWATYERPGGMRLDFDQRRDLQDLAENEHLDAALSFPLAAHVRFFAVTERPAAARLVKTGLEFVP